MIRDPFLASTKLDILTMRGCSIAARGLQAVKKGDEISFLLRREADVKPFFVEIDDIVQRRGGAVVEVRRAARKAAEDGAFQPADVSPQPSDQGPSRIGGALDLMGDAVLECDHREVANIERTVHVTDSDI